MWNHLSQNWLLFDSTLQHEAPFSLYEYVKIYILGYFSFFSVNVCKGLFEVKECKILIEGRFDSCL